MATGTYAPDPFEQYCDDDGNPLSSGSLTVYSAGTSTPVNTYSDVNLLVANTNPISLDAAGRPTSGAIFLTPGVSYKFILKDVLGATVATRDNISAVPINPNLTGSWIPVIGGSTSTSGQTYNFQFGTYVKLGSLVIALFSVQLVGKGTIVGNVQLQGLPFTSSFGTATALGQWQGLTSAFVSMASSVVFNTTTANITGLTAASGDNVVFLSTADLSNATLLGGTFMYTTTS